MDKEGKEPIIEKRASMPYGLTPFDRSVDMKIWNHRFKIYWLWLEGARSSPSPSVRSIACTPFSTSTIKTLHHNS